MYININTHTHIYIARKCVCIYMCVCVPIRMLKINGNHAEFRGCLEFSGLRSSTIALQSPSLQLAGRWAWRCTAHPPNCRDFFWVSFFNGPLFWSHCYTYTLHLSHPFFLWKANCSALTMFFSNTFRCDTPTAATWRCFWCWTTSQLPGPYKFSRFKGWQYANIDLPMSVRLNFGDIRWY